MRGWASTASNRSNQNQRRGQGGIESARRPAICRECGFRSCLICGELLYASKLVHTDIFSMRLDTAQHKSSCAWPPRGLAGTSPLAGRRPWSVASWRLPPSITVATRLSTRFCPLLHPHFCDPTAIRPMLLTGRKLPAAACLCDARPRLGMGRQGPGVSMQAMRTGARGPILAYACCAFGSPHVHTQLPSHDCILLVKPRNQRYRLRHSGRRSS